MKIVKERVPAFLVGIILGILFALAFWWGRREMLPIAPPQSGTSTQYQTPP